MKFINAAILPTIVLLSFLIVQCRHPKEHFRERSRLENRVFDSANVLIEDQKLQLFRLSRSIEDSTGSQIALVIIPSLKGRDLNKYSIQIAERLALGVDHLDDGVLITVVVLDRQARIEVSKGLELILRDEISAEILHDIMIPEFAEARFFDGLTAGMKQIGSKIIVNRNQIGKRP